MKNNSLKIKKKNQTPIRSTLRSYETVSAFFLSCHYTLSRLVIEGSHILLMHFLGRRGQIRKWLVVCSFLHLHAVGPSSKPHSDICSLILCCVRFPIYQVDDFKARPKGPLFIIVAWRKDSFGVRDDKRESIAVLHVLWCEKLHYECICQYYKRECRMDISINFCMAN